MKNDNIQCQNVVYEGPRNARGQKDTSLNFRVWLDSGHLILAGGEFGGRVEVCGTKEGDVNSFQTLKG